MESDILTIQEIADYLRFSYGKVRTEILEGRLKARKFGNQYRIVRKDFEEYLESGVIN